jgi:predicted O-methyltransferase YrrM
MNQLHLTGKTPEELFAHFLKLHPELKKVEQGARKAIPNTKKAIYPYQAALLYHLAKPYNGGRALEIGAAYGYSCFYLASAMSDGQVVTLNASEGEWVEDVKILERFKNVTCLHRRSFDYFKEGDGTAAYSLVFVDGDHRPRPLKEDMQYFNRLVDGGLIIFHDYSPAGSGRECPPVYEGINELAKQLGREPDVLVVDDNRVGMAGFIRKEGEAL